MLDNLEVHGVEQAFRPAVSCHGLAASAAEVIRACLEGARLRGVPKRCTAKWPLDPCRVRKTAAA